MFLNIFLTSTTSKHPPAILGLHLPSILLFTVWLPRRLEASTTLSSLIKILSCLTFVILTHFLLFAIWTHTCLDKTTPSDERLFLFFVCNFCKLIFFLHLALDYFTFLKWPQVFGCHDYNVLFTINKLHVHIAS